MHAKRTLHPHRPSTPAAAIPRNAHKVRPGFAIPEAPGGPSQVEVATGTDGHLVRSARPAACCGNRAEQKRNGLIAARG